MDKTKVIIALVLLIPPFLLIESVFADPNIYDTGFETGNFAPWIPYKKYSFTMDPQISSVESHSGSYSALLSVDKVCDYVYLYGDVEIPTCGGNAIMTVWDKAPNQAPEGYYLITIWLEPGQFPGGSEKQLYLTTGPHVPWDWTKRTLDLSDFEGQTVRIGFNVGVDGLCLEPFEPAFSVYIDDISFGCQPHGIPEYPTAAIPALIALGGGYLAMRLRRRE